MIGMLATKYQHGDYFLGRMLLFGRFGTLWPSGIKPEGLAVIYGRQGSGKSTHFAMNAICTHPGPGLFLDAKGELTQGGFARRGAGGGGVVGMGQKTYRIDPLKISGKHSNRYNPLFEISREENTDDALRLAFKLAEGLIKPPDGGGGENSWVHDGAREFAYGLALFVVDCFPAELCNLVTVRHLLQNGDPERLKEAQANKTPGIATAFDALLLRMTEERGGRFGHVIAGQAADVQRMADRTRGPILKELSKATLWLDLKAFQDVVSGCDFLLSDFLTERISVFVVLPLNELTGMAAGFVRFFLTMFPQVMIQKNPDRLTLPHGHVLLLVDEAPQYGNIDGLCSKIGPIMRDYQVRLLCLAQDAGQLVKVYGREEANTLHGCACFIAVMSMTHPDTVDWVVRSLGEKVVKERQADGRIVKTKYPLLDREQLPRYLAARTGNLIVLRFSDRPLRLRSAPYFWYLPFWMYTPDPRHPEPWLRAWSRRRAVLKAERQAAQRTIGKGVRHAARASA